MRKSFTLLFSTLLLLCAFGFSSFGQAVGLAATNPLTPADGADNVKKSTANLVVKFNQNVQFTSTGGTLTIYRGENAPGSETDAATLIRTVPLVAGSANATISTSTLTVKHGLTLVEEETYWIGITSNAIVNFAGIDPANWSFTIADETAPTVSSLSPSSANAHVQADPFQLKITFEDANDIVAVNGKKVWVYKADGTIIDIITISDTNTSIEEDNRTAAVTVSSNAFFDELTQYYVHVEAGAFEDVSGNKFAGISNNTTWTFSSRDYSAPHITEVTVTDVSYTTATLNATANEAGTIWYAVVPSSDSAPDYPGDYTDEDTDTDNSVSVALSNLTSGTSYKVYVIAENEAGDDQQDAETVSFTTLDNTAPEIVEGSNQQVVVSNVTVGLELTFDEEVKAGSGDLVVRLASNNQAVRTIAANSQNVTFAEDEDAEGNWIMTVLFEGLENEVNYYVIIPNGYVQDVAGNAYVSDFVATDDWAFKSSDFVAPTATVAIAGSTPPVATDNIRITFSEEVKLVDGSGMTGLSSNTDWFDYIALEQNNRVVPFTAGYANKIITIDPTDPLESNTTYTIKIRANAFEDLSGNAFSSTHKTYTVTTTDFGDAIITYVPADGENDLPQGTQPKIVFSKVPRIGTTPAAATPANLKPIIVFNKNNLSGANVAFSVEWDPESRTATLVPDAALESEGVYFVDINHTLVKDVNGVVFADPGTSTFTLIDYVPPSVAFSHSGTVDDLEDDADLTLEFSEDVTITGNLSDYIIFRRNGPDGAPLGFSAEWDSEDNTIIVITPSATLLEGATYYYGIGAGVASDAANNKNEAAFSTFTFQPGTPALVGLKIAENGLNPADGATNVKLTSGSLTASVTFTEAVKANPTMPAERSAGLYKANGDEVKLVEISAADFTGSTLSVTFTGISLTSEGEYYITIPAGVVVANADNNKTFAGIAEGEWSFTAADSEAPVLTVNTPAEDATGVALNAPVRINVSESVEPVSGNITITAGNPVAGATLGNGLLGLWDLEEASGNAIDSHGTNDGIITGALTRGHESVSTELGNSYYFTGNTETERVSVPYKSEFVQYDAGFSVSVWIKPEVPVTTPQTQTSVIRGPGGNGNTYGWRIMIQPHDNGRLSFLSGSGTSNPDVRVTGISHLWNTWMLVTATYDGSRVKLYVNGTDYVTEASDINIVESPSSGWHFLFGESGGANRFKGYMDQVAYFNRVLSAKEIRELYNGGSGFAYDNFGFDTSTSGNDGKTIAVSDVSISNGVITVPHEDFTQYGTEYVVNVPAGAFEDEGGNPTNQLTWSFMTVENPDELEYVLNPKHQEDLVAVGTSEFTITFAEDVIKGENGKRAYLYEVVGGIDGVGNTESNDIELGYVYVEQSGVQISEDNVVTLNFNSSLQANKEYYIVVEEGMFLDNIEPHSQRAQFEGLAAGEWIFSTKDLYAPFWEVSYDELVEGVDAMDITSDITITFTKPVDYNDAAITNTQITNLFNVTVGGEALAFTGTINAEKTVIVLQNSSFVPALTEANSDQIVSVTPVSGIKGVVSNQQINTEAVTFNIADYEAPEIDNLALASPAGADRFTFNVSSTEAGTIYWAVQEGTEGMAAEDVMAGTAITNYSSGNRSVTVTQNIVSESTYTVSALAVDATGNVSEVATLTVNTTDNTPPSLVGELPTVFEVESTETDVYADDGTLTLTFSEKVNANNAIAVIRKADTYQIVGNVALTQGGEDEELVITFDVSGFDDDQQFIIEIAGGEVADDSGNEWEGQMGLGDNAWIVSLPDRTPAQIVSIEPDITAGDLVGLNAAFKVTFDEPVVLADNFLIEIKFVDSSKPYEEWEIFELLQASNLTISGNVLTIDPTRAFTPDGRYELKVTHWSIRDLAGNGFRYDDGETVERTLSQTFSAVPATDNTAPTATFSPANGATGVSDNITTLSISFNEPIVLTDGSEIDKFDLETIVYVRKGVTDLAHTASFNGTNAITITLDPSVELEMGAQYTYGFTAAFSDAAGNAVGARSATFTIETEEEAESYITFDPDNGFVDPTLIPVDQTFRIGFSGELYTYSTVISQNNIAVTPTYLGSAITLTKSGGGAVPFTVTIEQRDEDTTIVVVNPNANLDGETIYDLAVLGGKLQIGVGHSALDGKSNNYITEDVDAPEAVYFFPEDGDNVSESATISIQFNEDVKAGTGTIEIKHEHGEVRKTVDASTLEVDEDNNKLVYISDLSGLEAGQEYFVIIPEGAITDLSDNAWEGISGEDDWNFTISEDPSVPKVISISPVGGNAPVNTSLRIKFDRPVVLNDDKGFIAIYTADGIAIQLIRVNDAGVNALFTYSANNTEVTVDIVELEQNTKYEVEVAEGTFVAQDDNSLENVGVIRSIWTFTTEINYHPQLVSLTPADNATNVRKRTVARMVFDIDVQAGTGTIDLRRGDNASIVHSFDVNSNEVVFNGKNVWFDLEGIIEGDSTDYYIIVPEGAITNISSDPEPFAGLEQTYDWNFTTGGDFTNPELVTWSPDDVELPGKTTNFVMEFNEDVVLANPGDLVVTKIGANQPTLVIPLNQNMISGNTITVTYDEATIGALEFESEYYVTIAGNIIEDLSDNPWAGVTDPTVWTFATKDRNVTIAEIQGTGSTSPMMDVQVRVTATVTGISMGEGFFMQDANAAWSGIWVEYGNAGSLAIGDGVVIIGNVTEISEVTTIVATEVQTVNAPVTVAPVVVASPTAVKAEMYESVLVQVLEAQASAANSAGVWNISYGTNDVVAVNRWMFSYTPEAGHIYDVTGIVNGRMSNYRMEPRRITDIIHYKPIADIQGTGPVSPVLNEVVHVMATVTAISTGEGFFMQDANEAWSGIWVEYANAASLSIGDGVKVVGSVSEISEVTSIVATSVESIDAPIEVEPVIVNSPAAAKAEMFESVLVQVKGAKGTAATNGIWRIFYETADNVDVNKWFYTYAPVADHFYDVTGVVNGRMSNYRLEPRMESDITDLTVNSIPEFSAVDFKVYPNPFSGHINIDNSERLTRVVITNIAGQRILDVQYPERTINTSNLVNGVYVISLFNEDGMVKSHRIVKR